MEVPSRSPISIEDQFDHVTEELFSNEGKILEKSEKTADFIKENLGYLTDHTLQKFNDNLEKKIIEIEADTTGVGNYIRYIISPSAKNDQKERIVFFESLKSYTHSVLEEKKNNPVKPLEVIDRIFWKMLDKCPPAQGNEEIVITGQVLGDGRGDWAAMRNMQRSLQKKFPDRTVRIIASSATKWDKPGMLDTSKLRAFDLTYYENSNNRGVNVPLSAFLPNSKIIEKIQNAGVVISAGVSIGGVFKPVLKEIQEKSIKIKEQDYLSPNLSIDFGSTVIQTGLSPEVDRAGVFLASNKKEFKWEDIANNNLKSVLFENQNPTKDQINAYTEGRECFFGYMNTLIAKIRFMQDVAAFAGANSPKKLVDICLPGFCRHYELGKNYEYLDRLKNQDQIGSIELVWFSENQKMEHTVVLGKGSQVVRVIDPGSLSAKDFKIITKISGPIVGCTGDNSLAQTLSYGKIPCYEPRFPAKFAGLQDRIRANFGEDSALYKYCHATLQTSTRDRDHSMAVPLELVEQAKALGKIIREESNFHHIIRGVVNEKLIRQKDPDFARREDEIRRNYMNRKISFEQLTEQFSSLLSEKGLL